MLIYIPFYIFLATYYWLFSATKSNENVVALRLSIAEISSLRTHVEASKERYNQALVGKEDTEERRRLMKELHDIQNELKELEAEEAKYAENDPELILNLEKNIDECISHANRWTDNIYTLVGFYRNRGNDMSTEQFLKHFQLPGDLEDIPPRVPKATSANRGRLPMIRKQPG